MKKVDENCCELCGKASDVKYYRHELCLGCLSKYCERKQELKMLLGIPEQATLKTVRKGFFI